MINGVMECNCGYRRNWFNIFNELFLIPCRIKGHKIIRSGKDIRKELSLLRIKENKANDT